MTSFITRSVIPFIAPSIAPFMALFVALSTLKSYEEGYKHPDIILKLFIISLKNILIRHSKLFVKPEDLAYFNKIEKHNKI